MYLASGMAATKTPAATSCFSSQIASIYQLKKAKLHFEYDKLHFTYSKLLIHRCAKLARISSDPLTRVKLHPLSNIVIDETQI
jgi:hypothetical protein